VVDFEPSEEQQLIVETVQQFAANEVRARSRDCDEAEKLPDDALAAAHELGLVANALDEAHGGGGERSALTAALIAEELAWGDLSIALAILSPGLAALPISAYGTREQKSRWLPRFTGDRFVPGSLAASEPAFRSDVFAPATQLKRDGAEVVVSGAKCLVPWLDGGDLVLVSATGDDGPCLVVLPRSIRGIFTTPERYMGLGALPTVELALDEVRVPADHVLSSSDTDANRDVLHRGRIGLAACAVGVARASYEVARDYAKEREAFGGPIAAKQAIAFKLADMAIEIDGARLLAWEAAWRADQGLDFERHASLALRQASRVALTVTDGAVQVLGGHGYTREYLPELHLRNARGFACFEALALV
jgi:alkylation response protein AidB-like acyl-CoA dehydrogenase